MNYQKSFGISLLGLAFLAIPSKVVADDSKDDGSDKTYYWQGSKINNLDRLGSTGFEEEQRHTQEGRNAEQYLSTIRQQMAHQAAADSKDKNTLDFSGSALGNPVEVIHGPSGVQVVLHADMLFDENTAALKTGAVDVLHHLQALLDRENQKSLHFLIDDHIADSPQSRDLDAERALAIVATLEFSTFD